MTESASTEVTKTKKRTSDVKVKDNVDFESLLLSEDVLTGLKTCGFQKPSPVQLKAIPLGRCGLDLVVQAKSGTGKTCVFSVIALESIVLKSQGTQVLILAPTREIAVQIWEVINSMGSAMPKLRCYTFIGGMPISDDKVKLKKCHIAVGTPGRVKQLIEEQALNTESIRLFILDEADKLMEEGFQETINWIFSSLPENKQMLALSATYPEILAKHLTAYMRNPTFVRLNTNDLSLLGIRQYYKSVPFSPLQQKAFEIKCKVLMDLFNGISFQQCLVFSNYQLRAQSLSDVLNREGWPATYISGSQDQQDRLTAMSKLKTFKCRVLISTDLTSRGIDAENVNLIINMDIPHDHETYLHRIGRAGRFGTYGAAITLVSLGKEMANLKAIENRANTKILPLPDPIPPDLAQASGFVDYSDHITVESMTDIEKNSANSTELIMGDTHERTERASVLPCDSLNDFKYQPVKTALEQNQEGDISVVKDYEALSQQTVNGDNMCTETSPDVEGLITTLESTVISEYAKMEQLLAFSDVTASGDAGTSCLPENGPNCSQRQLDLAPVHPASETYQMSDSKGSTSSEVSEQQVTLANSVPCNLKLPNAQMLQRFSKAINICHVNVPDFVLPNLGDITGRKKTSLSSYDDMMANYEQFQKTGESLQHSYQNLDSFDSSTYDAALQKVDAFFKCRQLERSKINIDSLEIGASCGRNTQEVEITSKVQDITADKKQDDLPVAMSSGKLDVCFTDSPVQFKEFGVKKCSNEAKGVGKTVTTANIAAVFGCVKSAEDNDKLVGFSELSSYFADSNTPGSPSSHGTGKKTCTKLGSPSACQTKECANKYMASPHRSTEDQKLGLDLMRRLQARHEADISEIDLSSSGSDTESDDAYTVGSSSNHDLGKNDRDEICDRFYANLESGALEGNTRYPEQPAYTHWPTFESAYEQQFAGNIGQPAYDYQSMSGCNYGSSQMNASYWHSGGMGPFPYQLWMQCANLLGSINAVQAAQYSWYCQQWYVYHRKCAKLYIDQYKKYKSKLK